MVHGEIVIHPVRSCDDDLLRPGASGHGGVRGGIVHATGDGNAPVRPTELSNVRVEPSQGLTTRGFSGCERSVSKASS